MLKRFNHEKLRFALAGTFNTSLDFILLNLFVSVLVLPVLAANTLSVTICVVISYFLNHYFVFRQASDPSWRSLGLFMAITGFSSIVIQGTVIWSFGEITRSTFSHSLVVTQNFDGHSFMEINTAKALAVGAGMVWNYLLYKYVVFKVVQRSAVADSLLPSAESTAA